jgi:hypothetical protein
MSILRLLRNFLLSESYMKYFTRQVLPISDLTTHFGFYTLFFKLLKNALSTITSSQVNHEDDLEGSWKETVVTCLKVYSSIVSFRIEGNPAEIRTWYFPYKLPLHQSAQNPGSHGTWRYVWTSAARSLTFILIDKVANVHDLTGFRTENLTVKLKSTVVLQPSLDRHHDSVMAVWFMKRKTLSRSCHHHVGYTVI